MCSYPGKEIADLCHQIARCENAVEELLRVGRQHSRLPAQSARAVLARSCDRRACAALERLLPEEEPRPGLGVVDYLQTVDLVRTMERG